MSVYYKFRSTNFYETIKINDYAILVENLKKEIYKSKKLWWRDQLIVVNAHTKEELDDTTWIPKCTSVVVSRLCRLPKSRMPIVVNRKKQKCIQRVAVDNMNLESSVTKLSEEINFDDFGGDLFAMPEVKPVTSKSMVQDAFAGKINISSPSMLDQKMQYQDCIAAGKDFGGGSGERVTKGNDFGWGCFEPKKPPQGYVCYRCHVPGHFIQHCPTNGDPSYDIKRERQPTDIRQSTTTSSGLDASPSVVSVLEPNKEFPPELHCPLCENVMKDAVMTTKCCFKSFCDACIRKYILSKSSCVCTATNILVDDLVPNQTIRNTISRMRESNGSSTQIAGSVVEAHESIHSDCPKDTMLTNSATCKSGVVPPSPKKDIFNLRNTSNRGENVANPTEQLLEKDRSTKASKLSDVTFQSLPEVSKIQENDMQTDVQVQRKLPIGRTAKQGRVPQHFQAENLMMPYTFYNPYVVPPHTGAMPYMMYATGPFSVPLEAAFPQDFLGGQGQFTPTFPPQSSNVNNSSTKSKSRTISQETDDRVGREAKGTRLDENIDGNKRKRRSYGHDQQVSSSSRSLTSRERKMRNMEEDSSDENRERHSKRRHTRHEPRTSDGKAMRSR